MQRKKLCAALTAGLLMGSLFGGFDTAAESSETDCFITLRAATTRICADDTGEEADKAILFTAETAAEADAVTLVDADTGEATATLYDDGGFTYADDGDEYMNDRVFSNYLDFSEKEVGDYAYYAQYTYGGTTYTSDSVTIHVYRLFTEQELEDMETVDAAIRELENAEEYAAMSVDEKVQAASNLLELLAEVDDDLGYALIQADSIVYTESVYQFEFQYACGVNYVWQVYTEPGTDSADTACFTYTNHGDSIEITGFDNSVSDVVIPSEIEDLPVTTIGNMAFFGSSITSLVIPDTVTVIDDYAFMGCEALTDVTLSENLTTISCAAFSNCTSLSEVTIPESVTSLEFSAFSKCTALTAVTILNADCEIYDSASTISNGSVLDASSGDVEQIPYYNGIIYGYADSTAQTYAETYGYTFAAIEIPATTTTTESTTTTTEPFWYDTTAATTTTATESTTTTTEPFWYDTTAATTTTTTTETTTTEMWTTTNKGTTIVSIPGPSTTETSTTTTTTTTTEMWTTTNKGTTIVSIPGPGTTETTTTTTKTSTETTAASTTHTTSAGIIGDVTLDGNVNLADSVFLNQYVSGTVTLNDLAYANADVNADGDVDGEDALVLLRFQVQLINSLPDTVTVTGGTGTTETTTATTTTEPFCVMTTTTTTTVVYDNK